MKLEKLIDFVYFDAPQELEKFIREHETINLDIRTEGGETPLMAAIREGKGECATVLLEHGANPNFGNSNGWYPLHFSIQERMFNVIQLLIEKGADVNLQDDLYGNTPIAVAIGKTQDKEIIEYLASKGANLDLPNKAGVTARQAAQLFGIDIGIG
ncbi:ankyrin repeat domain-containing protein [Chryseobacterium sp.]|uniref:ankyrin repeat domain-containing protein n=1 Tax=Chryseobacterium sp. TaxID=1871047 RepID=UPI00321AD4CA